MATVHFTSSDSLIESDPQASEHATAEISEYVEGTYAALRHGNGRGEGKEFAALTDGGDGAWELPDGRRFSDWAVDLPGGEGTVHFTSSESFMEHDPNAAEHAEVKIRDYVEGTYGALRHDADSGAEFAWFAHGAWELADGRRFSDWAVEV